MEDGTVTVIDDGRISEVTARVGPGGLRLSPAALRSALGWEVKPQGLCQGEQCIRASARHDLITADGIDLAAFADLLGRPFAVDLEERVVCLGAAAADRRAQLASLEAPDFTLPDLNGRAHSLSDYRGKKAFLVAYASW